jgi:hypothetical protein
MERWQETLNPYINQAKAQYQRGMAWLTRDEHKARARELRDQMEKAFTEHPQEAGETYLEHLWFTTQMTGRLIYSSIVILLHGIFPFILTTAASAQLERIYAIMRSRIPAARREVLDSSDWVL